MAEMQETDAPMLEENTEEQEAATRASEERWERERNWPLWRVILTGDTVTYVARAGMNLDDDGVPQPWNDLARCEVTLRAPNKDYAKMLALRANEDAGYHTVESAGELDF